MNSRQRRKARRADKFRLQRTMNRFTVAAKEAARNIAAFGNCIYNHGPTQNSNLPRMEKFQLEAAALATTKHCKIETVNRKVRN